jgi:putative NADPH-quinone reductase
MGSTNAERRIVVLYGHPVRESYCNALGKAYVEAARQAGCEVREHLVSELEFDPILWNGYRSVQPLEPDLLTAQQDILWANHLVFTFPIWWGVPPALLKGFIDRVFHPSFAFKYTAAASKFPRRLLAGRSARLICTMDSPTWYYRLFMGAPGLRMMKRSLLHFCGVSPVRASPIGSVRFSTPARRESWLEDMRRLGARGV